MRTSSDEALRYTRRDMKKILVIFGIVIFALVVFWKLKQTGMALEMQTGQEPAQTTVGEDR